jgi:hypothetical protein
LTFQVAMRIVASLADARRTGRFEAGAPDRRPARACVNGPAGRR